MWMHFLAVVFFLDYDENGRITFMSGFLSRCDVFELMNEYTSSAKKHAMHVVKEINMVTKIRINWPKQENSHAESFKCIE
jgi:hypothetical protein